MKRTIPLVGEVSGEDQEVTSLSVAPSHSLPDKQSLADLLARVEAATGPDRELDALIALATGLYVLFEDKHGYTCAARRNGRKTYDVDPSRWWLDSDVEIPRWSFSIDAALALAERRLPGVRGLRLFQRPNDWMADLTEEQDSAFARTAPLAILAALLRALSDKERDGSTQ